MTTNVSVRRLNLHYMALQSGFWAMYAAICAFAATLLGGRGFTAGQIGMLIAVRCLAGIFLQPALGSFADRHPNIPLKRIVAVSLVISLGASLVFQFVPLGLAGTVVICVLQGGFEISAYPLMDAMALQYISAGVPIQYSLGRGVGSFAYAVLCVLMGFQADWWGVESTLYTHLFFLLVMLLLVLTFPTFQGAVPQAKADQSEEKPHSFLYILRASPAFTIMLVGLLFGITANLPMSHFLINIMEVHGGGTGQLGIALFLMGAAELPSAFVFNKLYPKMGAARLLVLSMGFSLVKLLWFVLSPSLIWILLAQPLQMLGYGLFTPASVYFVDQSVPAVDRVKGQTLMMVATNGLGGMMGSLLAGQALDMGGVGAMLGLCVTCGTISVILCLLSAVLGRKKGRSHT